MFICRADNLAEEGSLNYAQEEAFGLAKPGLAEDNVAGLARKHLSILAEMYCGV